MRFISGKVGGNGSLEFAKNIINKIGNIEKIKIFNSEKTDYYEDFGIEKYYYNFIAFDDEGNEVWFDTNCGYRGSKPSMTEQILQLLGVRDEVGIYNEKYIDKKNLRVINDLNILVLSNNRHSKTNKELLMIKIKPNKAKDRLNVVRGLENIGSFKKYEKKMTEYKKKFHNVYDDKSFGEFKVNELLFISKEIKELKVEDLKKVLEAIIYRNIGKAMDVEIETL
ncbi:hypothetical protein [uncultured Clostridium sp.]|uniref:hypothetical protein n=1 Tax=uncultured Clostridium sp. TaxID=59620 RepID=UPI00263809F6|nr:hypothetical protein [uncultured Clostridium sp.]